MGEVTGEGGDYVNESMGFSTGDGVTGEDGTGGIDGEK